VRAGCSRGRRPRCVCVCDCIRRMSAVSVCWCELLSVS
jgi:hypothetical protein